MTRCINIVVLSLVGTCAFATLAVAQNETAIEQWLRDTARRGVSIALPTDIELRWSAEGLAVPAERLARWQREVEGLPSHPQRTWIAIQERRSAKGPDKIEDRLLYHDANTWRLVHDQEAQAVEYMDSAVGSGVAWALSNDTLSLFDAEDTVETGDFAADALAEVRDRLAHFVSHGLSRTGLDKPESAVRLTRNGADWRAQTTTAFGWTVVIDGAWDSAAQRPVVKSVSSFSAADTGREPDQLVLVGAVRDDPIFGPLAESLDVHTVNDREVRHFRSARRVSQSDVAVASAPPDPAGLGTRDGIVDPIRGRLTATRVQDLRRNSRTISTQIGDDWATQKAPPLPQRDRWLSRPLAWISVAIVVGTLLFLRWRAHRSQTRTTKIPL